MLFREKTPLSIICYIFQNQTASIIIKSNIYAKPFYVETSPRIILIQQQNYWDDKYARVPSNYVHGQNHFE